MVNISFTQFRQEAKKYFERVEKGETVRVLRHGKVIAEIIPPTKAETQQKNQIFPMVIPGVSLSRAILTERKKYKK